MKTEILIVGGGLSGLALAEQLHARSRDFLLIEARDRLGGRILTEHLGGGYFDLGPTWFWAGNKRILALINRLELKAFEQFADGQFTYEDEGGQVQRGPASAMMQGSYRLEGGMGALVGALRNMLPADRLHLNAGVVALTQTRFGVTAQLSNGVSIDAKQVILTAPPRVIAECTFTPALPAQTLQAMTNIATWMAGHAKALAVYDRPFWRDAGLSGDAMSRHGPMVEIHDASPADGRLYGLFGFIGVPPQGRADAESLRAHLFAQLIRLFGSDAADPVKLYVKDWAFDPNTATEADLAPLFAHPIYHLPTEMTGLWDGRLLFGGTEVAPENGGYLEGALEAAENVLNSMQHNPISPENAV